MADAIFIGQIKRFRGMIFYKTFILGNFSDRCYSLDWKCYKKSWFMKIIGICPGVYIGRGVGHVLKHLWFKSVPILFGSNALKISRSISSDAYIYGHTLEICGLYIPNRLRRVVVRYPHHTTLSIFQESFFLCVGAHGTIFL